MRDRFPVFDLHCDTAVRLRNNRRLLQNDLHVDLTRGSKLLHHHQFYAFCCVMDRRGEPIPTEEAERRFFDALFGFLSETEQNRDRVRLCRCAEDLIATAKEEKSAAFLSLEGPEVINCDPGRLEELKELGITMTTLTWNHANALAGSHLTGEGLSAQGKAFVRRAQELGIVIDVSHLSDRAFWDLIKITSAPIVASHSNSRAICANSRNLTDEQFKVICNLGGLVGMNLYAEFLNDSGKATFADVQRHLEHFLELGGRHFVALGGDLDGCDALPEGFCGIESYNELGACLMRQGMDETLVMNVMNNNAVRFVLQHLQIRRVG